MKSLSLVLNDLIMSWYKTIVYKPVRTTFKLIVTSYNIRVCITAISRCSNGDSTQRSLHYVSSHWAHISFLFIILFYQLIFMRCLSTYYMSWGTLRSCSVIVVCITSFVYYKIFCCIFMITFNICSVQKNK